jgi:hypothetical protein
VNVDLTPRDGNHLDLTDPREWGTALGFAFVPLYGHPQPSADTERGVLLDGPESSFHIFTTDEADDLLSDRSLLGL